MDEAPQIAQVPPQVSESPAPPLKKLNIRKIFDVGSWSALFILTPVFFIAMLSQNSLPGDLLYPVKRGIESSLLAMASVSPTTKAFLIADISDRRFTEADTLLLSQANTAPLDELIAQVESAEAAVSDVSSPEKQEELTTKIIAQIDTYQTKLTSTAVKIQASSQPFTAVPLVSETSSPSPTAVQSQPTQTQIAASPPSPTPTQTAFIPTAVPFSPPSSANPQEDHKKRVEEAIEEAKQRLDKVKKELEEKAKQREERQENRIDSGRGNINLRKDN